MRGYWNKPEQTADALRHGWYHSGDLGCMNAQGYIFLVDRAKDMIISGGENVYSTEVEDTNTRPSWKPLSSGCPMRRGGKRCTRLWSHVQGTRWIR
jgi:hypothetical protein